MKKLLIITLLTLSVSFLLCACKDNSKVSESTIRNDIEMNEVVQTSFVSEFAEESEFAITEFSIEKRQTNLEEKNDVVYSNLTVQNHFFEIQMSVKSLYNYYDDGGWILDEIEMLEQHVKPITAPSGEAVVRYYNEKIQEEHSRGILFINADDRQYWVEQEIEFVECNYNDTEATVTVLYETPLLKAYGDIDLKFDTELGWQITSIYDFTDGYEEYVYQKELDVDYSLAMGEFVCKSGYYKGAILRILEVDQISIEYEMILPSATETEYISSPGRRGAIFEPMKGILDVEYTYNGMDIPFGKFSYDVDTDKWRNEALVDFHFSR